MVSGMKNGTSERARSSSGQAGGELTPLLRQFQQIKAEHPEHILFFRCGDFYEMFFEDAKTCSEVLGITLTSRGTDTTGNPVPLSGIPYHSVENYLARMIRAGYRVAICEQTENPKTAKGVVRREVVRVVTPGTVLEDNLLDNKSNNYLAAVLEEKGALGLAALDFSTGQFAITEFHGERALEACQAELVRLGPSELLISRDQKDALKSAGLLMPEALEAYATQGSDALQRTSTSVATVDPAAVSPWAARDALLNQMGVRDLTGFGAEDYPLAVRAAGAILAYLKDTQRTAIGHINELRVYHPGECMVLDPTTQRSLELVANLTDASRRHTLLEVLDRTATAMGARLLRGWLLQPLRDPGQINSRLDAVECFVRDGIFRSRVLECLKAINDLERIVSRSACRTANARDLLALKNSLQQIPRLKRLLGEAVDASLPFSAETAPGAINPDEQPHATGRAHAGHASPPSTRGGRSPAEELDDPILHSPPGAELPASHNGAPAAAVDRSGPLLRTLCERLNPLEQVTAALEAALVEQPPQSVREGGMIREGFHPQLDELRSLTADSKTWIARMRQEEIERTGIPNLKIGFNRVFGYYIEVSNSHSAKVPPTYIRKQTLAGAERYVTAELKEKEEVILHAEERSQELEFEIFERLRNEVCACAREIQATARGVAQLDVLTSLAQVAVSNRYCRPVILTTGSHRPAGEYPGAGPQSEDPAAAGAAHSPPGEIFVRNGRHPVLEALRLDQPFVPNDTMLDNAENQVLLITGPNMAGKSTYIRQVALITLLAHVGSFVPASEARISPVDRIFTRVGAMDQLAKGQSTFLVEMSETANILNNATDHSLVILDEIGRGTSTYDGLSIAWAVAEYLHNTKGRRPKTLFATHYHELTSLEGPLPRLKNYHVAVAEEQDRIMFLYRILRGATDRSYGIHAAQVAGLPRRAIDRARRILADLERGNAIHVGGGPVAASSPGRERPVRIEEKTVQLTLFDATTDPVRSRLREIDCNSLTPMQALSLLSELCSEARRG